MIWSRHRYFVAAALCMFIAAAGCAPARDDSRVTVFAASSLAEVMTDLAHAYERSRPGVTVDVNLAGSQVLRLQIERGARADVFVSASPDHVHALRNAGLVASSSPVASNDLVVIVPVGNPAGLESLRDLTKARRLVVADPAVPAGQYTAELLRRAGEAFGPGFLPAVHAAIVSREISVRLVRAKVELGEADAAVVYRTDALGTDRVIALTVPGELNVRAHYEAAVLHREGADQRGAPFAEFLGAPAAQAIFTRHGFAPGGSS